MKSYPKELNLKAMLVAAGYREKDILNNLKSWTYEDANGYKIYTFYHKDGEHAAQWSAKLNRWTN